MFGLNREESKGSGRRMCGGVRRFGTLVNTVGDGGEGSWGWRG